MNINDQSSSATALVLFKDTFEEDSSSHFGLRLLDETILCLECGGILEPEDYKILHNYGDVEQVEQILQKHMWKPEKEDC